MRKPKITFIGIGGASGSGKSTLCKSLKKSSGQYEHIRLDNYFKHPKFFPKEKGFVNWEKPSNLKFETLLSDLKKLSRGEIVYTQTFPKRQGTKIRKLILKPKKYILVEGFVIYLNKALRDFLDIKIFLSLQPNLIIKRRAKRFGNDQDTKYDKQIVVPEYLKTGLKQRRFADYIINANLSKYKIYYTVKRIIEKQSK